MWSLRFDSDLPVWYPQSTHAGSTPARRNWFEGVQNV